VWTDSKTEDALLIVAEALIAVLTATVWKCMWRKRKQCERADEMQMSSYHTLGTMRIKYHLALLI
jgi:hypothetical protein